MINPYVLLGVVVAFVLSVGGSGWYGKDIGYQMRVAEEARDKEVADQAHKEALAAAAAEIAKIDVKQVTVQGKVIERIRTEQVYSECRHSPDSWALIQEAFRK